MPGDDPRDRSNHEARIGLRFALSFYSAQGPATAGRMLITCGPVAIVVQGGGIVSVKGRGLSRRKADLPRCRPSPLRPPRRWMGHERLSETRRRRSKLTLHLSQGSRASRRPNAINRNPLAPSMTRRTVRRRRRVRAKSKASAIPTSQSVPSAGKVIAKRTQCAMGAEGPTNCGSSAR